MPPGVGLSAALALVALSTLTSMLTASIGIGGGTLLLAAMAQAVPVAALVPVHGVVQLGSNTGRAILLAKSTAWALIAPFAVGATLGAAIGAAVVTQLPAAVLLLAIGSFVLVTTWIKMPAFGQGERAVLGLGGAVATFLTMFVGATGPFVVALLRPAIAVHRCLVATTAVALTLQHALKVTAFASLGFQFAAWAPLMAAMVVSGFYGTFMGTRLLGRLPEMALKRALKVVLTALGLELAVRGVSGLL